MFKEFADKAAFKSHHEQDHFKQVLARLPEFLAGTPEFRRYWVSDATVQNRP